MFLDLTVVRIQLDLRNTDLLTFEFAAAVAHALGAGEELANPAVASGELATLAVDVHVIAKVEVNAEEIRHVTGFPACPTVEADGGDRQATEEPNRYVQVVKMLFDDVVTGEFVEIELVASEVAGIGLALVAALDPWDRAVPLDHAAFDFADGTGVDAPAGTDGFYGDGLLDEAMFSRFHCGVKMERTE